MLNAAELIMETIEENAIAEAIVVEIMAAAEEKEAAHGHGRHNRKKSIDFNLNKFCTVHNPQGHDAMHCRKAASERGLNEDGSNGSKQSDRPYQPKFSPPYRMSAQNPHKWIVDSAANAYIASFKTILHNYIDFTENKNVKGFGGKKEKAYGQGSITLTDSEGHEEILQDVVYVPESPDQILSLMKFRRQHSADFRFTDLEGFTLSTPTGFSLNGQSVNDILYIQIKPSIWIMAAQTHNQMRKRKR